MCLSMSLVVEITIQPRFLMLQFGTDFSNSCLAILEITSTGFLYHQIRITMTILLHIGIGNEKPEIILDLLDVDKWKKRMQLCMASDVGLVLTSCDFEENLAWENVGRSKLLDHFSKLWFEKVIEAEQVQTLMKKYGFWDGRR